MAVEVRAVDPGELSRWLRAQEAAWGEAMGERKFELLLAAVEPERAVAAVDGGRFVGFAAFLTSSLGLPGGRVPAAGCTAVAVHPTHRRRGVLRALMRAQLDSLRGGREPLAMLTASEAVIYRRFGYGLATMGERVEIETAHAAFRRPPEPGGTVELVDEEGFLLAAPELYRRLCEEGEGIPGSIGRSPAYWRLLAGNPDSGRSFGPRQFALLRDGAGAQGYAVYRLRGDWTPSGPAHELRIEEMLAAPGGPAARLWRFLLDYDLVRTVTGMRRPVDDVLPHLLADPRRLVRTLHDDVWVRPVDVAACLEGRRYPVAGELVLDVADEVCPWVAGRYRLEGGPDGARCTAGAGATADLAMDAAALGSLLCGGVGAGALARAGVVEELRAGAAARAAAMFAWHRAPWNLAEF